MHGVVFCFCLVVRQVKPRFMSFRVSLRMSLLLRRPAKAVVAFNKRANTTHGWLLWLRHCPARHQHTSFDVGDPGTLAKVQITDATLALVQQFKCFEHTPLLDTRNLKFWIVISFPKL